MELKGIKPIFVEDNNLYVLSEYIFNYLTNKSGNVWVFIVDIRTFVRIKDIDDYKLENVCGQTYKVYKLI